MTQAEDDLMLLWQQGVSEAPEPAEVARLAARASMRRFDRVVSRRNVIEFGAAALVLAWFGWNTAIGEHRLANAVSFGCVAFVVGYLWWYHRGARVADASADAAAYHAALLARLDRQIALLRTVRYWYLLPLFVPPVLTALAIWEKSRPAAVVFLVVVGALYVGLGVLNERVAVNRLLDERARLEALYRE